MTTDPPSAALLSERYGAPVWLFERSAAARAKASRSTVDAVLDTWVEEVAGPEEGDRPEEADSRQPTADSPEEGNRQQAEDDSEQPTGDRPEEADRPEEGNRQQAEDDSEQPTANSPEEADRPEEGNRQQATGDSPEAGAATGVAAGLSGAALLAVVAEARGMPESVIERSAKARASAAGVDLDDVLHEWAEEEGLEPASTEPPAPKPKAATSAPLPTPRPKADSPEEGDSRQPTADSPKAGAATGVAAGLSGAALLTAVAEARGMPESLVERSAKARAKKTDATVDDVLHEWAQEAGLAGPEEVDSGQQTADSPKVAAVGGGLSGAALLTAVAEARGMPESLVERSAKARAKKTDVTADDVLNEWAQEAGLAGPEEVDSGQQTADRPGEADSRQPTADSLEVAAVGGGLTGAALLTAVAEARGMPESLVERSAKARAKKTDTTVDDVLNEWAEEAGLAGPEEVDSGQQTADSPKVAAAGAGLSGAALLTAVAEARGMPESLVERSAKARAKKTDTTVDGVLNEWAQEAGLVTDSPEEADSQQPTADSPESELQVSEAGIQEPDTKPEPVTGHVRTWRHALAIGAITALVPLVILVALAVFVDVPTDLSEAPWYLLGLQPFLTYLDPFVALIIIPGVVLASIVILPFVAWNRTVHPSIRRLAIMVLAFLLLMIVVLTIVGAFTA